MRKIYLLWTVLLTLALAAPTWAQPGPGGPGMGGRGPQGPMLYNPQTETTVQGTVEKLETISMMGRQGAGGPRGMRAVLLKTDQGPLTVHLGPVFYLAQQNFVIKVGDVLEVTGSKVTLADKPAIIAREVKSGGKTLTLRDEQGLPKWRRMGGMGPGGMGPGGMGPGGMGQGGMGQGGMGPGGGGK